MADHVYRAEDTGEADVFDVKRKRIVRDGRAWVYSHPVVQLGDIRAGHAGVMIEPDWAHTVYQAGYEETDAWRKAGGAVDPKLNMPYLRNRTEIDAYKGFSAEFNKGSQDNRYDFGPFQRRR